MGKFIDNPYAHAAREYTDKGWPVLPAKINSKSGIPWGYTGGPDTKLKKLTPRIIERWMTTGFKIEKGCLVANNLVASLPDGVIAIDVDNYWKKPSGGGDAVWHDGKATLDALEGRLGKLPDTATSTNRSDDVSGHRFYRVPLGRAWPSNLGSGIDILHQHYRYAVLWPSMHPDGVDTNADGTEAIDEARRYHWVGGSIPRVSELAELPAAWVEEFDEGPVAERGTGKSKMVSDKVANIWREQLPDEAMCAESGSALELALSRLSNRHDTMKSAVLHLVIAQAQGHRGIKHALSEFEDVFEAETFGEEDRPTNEFDDMLRWSITAVEDNQKREPGHPYYVAPYNGPCKCTDYSAWELDEFGELVEPTAVELEEERAESASKKMLLRSELRHLPRVEPLINDVLSLRATALMFGPSRVGKSFASLGMMLSVATGKPWLGHEVAVQAPVLYVVGEGAYGLDDRISAWEHEHNAGEMVDDDLMSVIVRPTSLLKDSPWDSISKIARRRGVRFVVLDTLSSLASDADETKDSPVLTRRLTELSAAIDGTAMLIHHTGWSNEHRSRGGSQFEANVDEVLRMQQPEEETNRYAITRKKVKDGADGYTINVARREALNSMILVPGEFSGSQVVNEHRPVLEELCKLGLLNEPGALRTIAKQAQAQGASGGLRKIEAAVSAYRQRADNVLWDGYECDGT